LVISVACAQQENPPYVKISDDSEIYLEKIIDGIDIPWGMVFISDDEFLVSDKKGILYHVQNGIKKAIKGLPKIDANRQGGLLDLAIDLNFNDNKFIYFTASVNIEGDQGSNTALYRAKYDKFELTDLTLLYKATPNSKQGRHFGGKILIDNRYIYFTIGDRGNRDVNPQDITRDGGKIYRINLDGTIPKDNPFVNNNNAKKAIWSYGHRNQQGIIFGPSQGEIWANEHGPRGGDEINIIRQSDTIYNNAIETRNYGWPLASYGINYSGTKFTNYTSLEGTQAPMYYWTPSIAPSGFVMLKSDIYPKWKGNLFVGSLSYRYLERIELVGTRVMKREKILNRIGRVRNIIEGPDGFLYVSVENKGIFKIIPDTPETKTSYE
jgi:glucose/arabinose dehydrogenase